MVSDGIDNKRELSHFPAGGDPGTMYDETRARAKHDQQ